MMHSRIQLGISTESSNFSPHYLFLPSSQTSPKLCSHISDGNSKLWVSCASDHCISLHMDFFFTLSSTWGGISTYGTTKSVPNLIFQRIVALLHLAEQQRISPFYGHKNINTLQLYPSLYISSTKMCSLNSLPSVSISLPYEKNISNCTWLLMSLANLELNMFCMLLN